MPLISIERRLKAAIFLLLVPTIGHTEGKPELNWTFTNENKTISTLKLSAFGPFDCEVPLIITTENPKGGTESRRYEFSANQEVSTYPAYEEGAMDSGLDAPIAAFLITGNDFKTLQSSPVKAEFQNLKPDDLHSCPGTATAFLIKRTGDNQYAGFCLLPVAPHVKSNQVPETMKGCAESETLPTWLRSAIHDVQAVYSKVFPTVWL
jgi:hypothetical protein